MTLATTHLWWYLARSNGIVAWVLVTLGVLWGLALSSRAFGRRPKPAWLLDLHRFLGGLALLFTGLHVASIVLDSYVHVSPLDALVPLAGDYRPGAVAWGVIGLYLLAAVEVSSLLRRHLSKRTWRAIHYSSFPLFFMVTVHGITAGTDAGSIALRGSLILGTAAVTGLTVVRAVEADRAERDRPPSQLTRAGLAARSQVGVGS